MTIIYTTRWEKLLALFAQDLAVRDWHLIS